MIAPVVAADTLAALAHDHQVVFADVRSYLDGRDTKGLYAKARAGELTHFTGVNSPYEAPTAPDIRIDALTTSPKEAAAEIITRLIPLR